MAPRRAAGLVFAIMGLPMFFTGAMLGLLLGFEYSMTSFAIGAVFLVIGIIVMALPAPPRNRFTAFPLHTPCPRAARAR